MTFADASKALDALYAGLPIVPCRQLCQESCGVIVMSRVEWVRITRRLGYRPRGKTSLVCPMLKQGRCIVHAIRPMNCRLYGALHDQRMRCPYGCVPDRILSDEEFGMILATVERISREVYSSAELSAPAQRLALEEISVFVAAYQKGADAHGNA